MKALAFVASFNESDIIGWTVRHLRRQGLEVLVIDCQSTDGTERLAEEAGALIYPYDAPPVSWHALLGCVERLVGPNYDWLTLCDADELRYSYIEGETLLEAFARVDRQGYNAIDHRVVTFHPVDNGFDGTQDPEQHFRYFSSDLFNERIGQVKAWKNVGPVSIAASGGHQVAFRGRRIYPMKFISKHYPIRSQAHGERKVFQERKWLDQAQGRADWHVQYANIGPGYNFLRDRRSLSEWGKTCE